VKAQLAILCVSAGAAWAAPDPYANAPAYLKPVAPGVGAKDPTASDPLVRNGLKGGKLYVAKATDPAKKDEATFNVEGDQTRLEWAEVPDPTVPDTALDPVVKALGSFNFVRLEDVAADPSRPGTIVFDTTGAAGKAASTW
jgi:hypothetical protein